MAPQRPIEPAVLRRIVSLGVLVLAIGGVARANPAQPAPSDAEAPVASIAAPPGCDVLVPAGQGVVDRADPGAVICLEAGSRGALVLRDLEGTAAEPIVVVNHGGDVRISAGGEYAAIRIEDSSHLHVTGTGVRQQCGATVPKEEQRCGIRMKGSFNGLTGKVRTEHLTVDHVEITDVEAAGVGVHDRSAGRDWVQHDVAVRHSYLRDIGTEGFYIGASSYAGGDRHLLDGVEISDNFVLRTGRDGIQVGSAPTGCVIQDNLVRRAGLDEDKTHAFGIIVNRGASCDVLGNHVERAAGDGIYDQGLHGQLIARNTVVASGRVHGGAGINVRRGDQGPDNPETPDYPRSTSIIGNTIREAHGHGIRLRNDAGRGNLIERNVLADLEGDPIELGGGVTATIRDNTVAE